MKTLHIFIVAFAIIIPSNFVSSQVFPIGGLKNATVKVRVVDEDAKPIQGVRADYYSLSDDDSKPGLTDTNGMYSVKLKDIYFQISGFFTKQGYYKTRGVFWKWDKWGGVPPANTNFTIVLKRIIDPVPLKHKAVRIKFPRLNESFGFDFEVGDWVFPDGKGKIADVFIKGDGFHNSWSDYEFSSLMEFVGEHNGMQSFYYPEPITSSIPLRSELPPPTIAPETGYTNMFARSLRQFPSDRLPKRSSDKNRKWIYRIRTEVDENGKIIRANYGWMTEDYVIGSATDTGVVVFNYYYNPDPHSRSLEPKEIAERQNRE